MPLVRGTGQFQGLPINDVRPGAVEQQLAQLLLVAQDQAELWERITNLPVPGAGSLLATPHNHDGINSAVIPIPLASGWLGATLPAARAGLAPDGAYAPLVNQIVRVPPGVDKLFVSLWADFSRTELVDSVQVHTFDGSLAIVDQAVKVREREGFPGIFAEYRATVDVTPGQLAVVRVEAWDGEYVRGSDTTPQPARAVRAFTIRPGFGDPVPVQPYSPPGAPSSEVITPDQAYNQVGAVSAFTPFDSSMFVDYRSVNAFLTQRLNANLAVLLELLTGLPSGNNPIGHANLEYYAGHNHKDDGTTDLQDCGAEIDHPLGAWFYGVARQPPSNPAQRPSFDDPGNSWQGRLFGPALTQGGSVWYELTRHKLRIPNAKSANLFDDDPAPASGTKLKAAALVYHDAGKSGGMDLEFQLTTLGGGIGGTPIVVPVPAGPPGLYIVQADDLDAVNAIGPDGLARHDLRIRARVANTDGTSNLIYSSCAWYEA